LLTTASVHVLFPGKSVVASWHAAPKAEADSYLSSQIVARSRVGYGFSRSRNGAAQLFAVTCLPSVIGAWQYEGGGAHYSNHRGLG
jgi:anaerobic selenocysteine-containing dehydrogenase